MLADATAQLPRVIPDILICMERRSGRWSESSPGCALDVVTTSLVNKSCHVALARQFAALNDV